MLEPLLNCHKELQMSSVKRQFHVFIIHAHLDRQVVRDLYIRLTEEGFQLWLDVEKLLPGQNWEYEIRKAILKSDAVIVCLSQHFGSPKGFRHKELKIALRKANVLSMDDIFIIPVRLEKCDMPNSLRHLHRVDLFERGGYKRLIRALREHAEAI